MSEKSFGERITGKCIDLLWASDDAALEDVQGALSAIAKEADAKIAEQANYIVELEDYVARLKHNSKEMLAKRRERIEELEVKILRMQIALDAKFPLAEGGDDEQG